MHAAKLPPDALRERAAARSDYYDRIGENHMTPLWEVLHALVPTQPQPLAHAAIWRYAELLPVRFTSAEWGDGVVVVKGTIR